MKVSARTTSKQWRDVVQSRNSRKYRIEKNPVEKGSKLRCLSEKISINTMKLQIGT
jgi:hypothetical protein